jgi:beta-alanine degradation protein BauB
MSERLRAVPTVKIDNARLRVTEWRFPPGGATGWHRHEYDYCVVPITSGTLRLEEPDGVRETELITGQPYFRTAGVEHDVVNINPFEFVFVDIEVKGTET